MEVSSFIVIGAPVLVLVMIWAFARNAIAMKRDLDQRFERVRSRLESDAAQVIDTLLRERSGKNGSS